MPASYRASPVLFTALILQGLALAWGAARSGSSGNRSVLHEAFDGPECLFAPDESASIRFVEGELRFRARERSSALYVRPRPEFEAGPLDVFRIRMAVEGTERTTLKVFFKHAPEGDWIPIALPIVASAEMQWSEILLGERPEWRGRIRAFRVDPVSSPGARVRIDEIELIRSPEPYIRAGWSSPAVRALAGAERAWLPLTALWLVMAAVILITPPRRVGTAAAWLFLLALEPRVLYSLIPLLDALLQSDPLSYRDLGLAIWKGETLRGDPVWGWGWQVVMALLVGPSGGIITAWARGGMILLGAASCPIVFALCRRAGGRRAAIAGALLFAAAEEPVRLTGLFFGETLFALLVALYLLSGFQAARKGAGLRPFCFFTLWGAAMILTRSQSLPLAVAWAVWVWARGRGMRRSAWALAAPALAAVIVAPVNWNETGRWIAYQTGFGYNLAAGHNPAATGKWEPIEEAWRKKAREGKPDPAELDRRYGAMAFDYIKAKPGAALRLTAVKASYFLNPFERRDWMYSPSFPIPLIPRPAIWILFAAGLALAGRRLRASAWIVAQALLTFLVVSVFYYGPRYLVPVFPCASFFAALALGEVARILRKWRTAP